jgi:hypothetical protein
MECRGCPSGCPRQQASAVVENEAHYDHVPVLAALSPVELAEPFLLDGPNLR